MIDGNKIGLFIKELRTENNMSQYDLADLIPIDRSVVSKWERGETNPPIDKIVILCNIFKVDVDELISGERKTVENKVEHENNLIKFLLNQDIKYKKLKYSLVAMIIIALLAIFMLLTYYFLETHDTEKVYRLYGYSDNYQIENGLLVITREKSYIKLGAITRKEDTNDKSYDISFYYRKDNEDIIIYEGDSDYLLSDRYGYNAVLNRVNLDEIKNNLYIKVNEEEIKLNLTQEYRNDNYILDDWEKVLDKEINIDNNLIIDVDKIKKEFECSGNMCRKVFNDFSISYDDIFRTLYIKNNEFKILYDSKINKFSYENIKNKFDISNNEMICNLGKCENYKEIYYKYYENIIKKYLK